MVSVARLPLTGAHLPSNLISATLPRDTCLAHNRKARIMTSSTLMTIAAVICGVALLYLVVSRTLKKRDEEN